MPNAKRILSIEIKRESDDSPDASYLGGYSRSPESEFSIDRAERGDVSRNEYRFFNPGSVEDFDATASWIPENITDATERRDYWLRTMRENSEKDYERMESLNNGNWFYVCVRVEAKIVVTGVRQTISSGGLYGIESDLGESYFAEVADEELFQLKDQLSALGFSKRAISKAFQDAKGRE